MDSEDRAAEAGPTVGVVGADPSALDGLSEAIAALDGRLASGAAADVLARDPTVIVAVGDEAVASLARRDGTPPLLPVACPRVSRSVPRDRAGEALSAVLAAPDDEEGSPGHPRWTEREHPTLVVTVADEEVARGFFEVALVTDEPATISEFSARTATERLGRFRADGVVVASPSGSRGYARAAGGPALASGVDALSVVPVSPFLTERTRWVVPVEAIRLTVERDEVPISLQVDARVIETLPAEATVGVEPGRCSRLLLPEGENGASE